jgi:hypothetical protein
MLEPPKRFLCLGWFGLLASPVVATFWLWSAFLFGSFLEDDYALHFIASYFLSPVIGLILLGFSRYNLNRYRTHTDFRLYP